MEDLIDLHLHTSYSDGQYNVSKLLEECEKANLSVISITDHDSAEAYIELENNPKAREIFSGEIIAGIELSYNDGGYLFDVLGYNIDYKKMQQLLDTRMSIEDKKVMQAKLLEEWKEVCRSKGIKFDDSITITNGTKSEAYNILYTDISDFDKYP